MHQGGSRIEFIECKLVDCYVTAVSNCWLCCGEYLYQSRMKDILLLGENEKRLFLALTYDIV